MTNTIEESLKAEIKRLTILVREEILKNKGYKEKIRQLETQLEAVHKKP